MMCGLKQVSLSSRLNVSFKNTQKENKKRSNFLWIPTKTLTLLYIYFFKGYEPRYLTGLQVMLILFPNNKNIQLTLNIVGAINSHSYS